MANLMIGICGGTGSGKTTLAERIAAGLGEDALLLSMDSYYADNSDKTMEERCRINYDHPDAYDTPLLLSQLKTLKEGGEVDMPVYDFTVHNRASRTVHVAGKPVIIMEGILLFAIPEIVSLLDIKVFVDTDDDVRIIRRILRDVKERGRSLDSVVEQYLSTVKPMHEQFIAPGKRVADVIIPEGGKNLVAYEMLYHLLKEKRKGI